ncbi:MAG TPA: 4-(cytidine 5'-diphospho)-2-C-methyl-D-erythritol kinase [Thermoleophilaceae bacterium]|nr:4-(cytidine 5'-diphospho)-2-C-methyl-D-erythritol kinase [Thermoleophilaceae bacterium]
MIRELAPAKLNLVLHVGPPRSDGMHPLCSLFASLELADELEMRPADAAGDVVECPGVEGPNLVAAALAAFRERAGAGALPPVRAVVDKRIPVAAGLGGGSADAAAALRAANRLAGEPLRHAELAALAAGLGSDVPSQVDPGHALVLGVGEVVEPVALPALHVVLVPQPEGLRTPDVYAELDRLEGWRERLDPEPLRHVARASPGELAAAVENDLERAAVSLRPELGTVLAQLRAAGASASAVAGSGPTCFALFVERDDAERAVAAVDGVLLTRLR